MSNLTTPPGQIHVLRLGPVEVRSNMEGPCPIGDLAIGGGVSLWVKKVTLNWDPPPRDYPGGAWSLTVILDTRLPDRHNPESIVQVGFSQNFSLYADDQGNPLSVQNTKDTWVANRVLDTIEWASRHEAQESVSLDGDLIRDPHAHERLQTA